MEKRLSLQRRLTVIFAGGFCGTLLRVLLSAELQSRFGNGWPYDILFINITGAFLLALLTVCADASLLIGPTRRLFINVGFLGAYTTFSSLALGNVLLFSDGKWLLAWLYLVCSLVGGMLAVLSGDRAGQWFVAFAKRLRAGLAHKQE